MDPRLRGVSPVVETPFHADGTVDLDGFGALVEHLAGTGVTSMMFPGFASEFHKLSDAESDALIERYLEVLTAHPGVAAIVSVPTHATLLAARRVRAAVAAGADAINVLPPHFLGPSPDDVRRHIAATAEAAGTASLIVQYAPQQTGAALDPDVLADLASAHANLRIVKVESSPPGPMITALARTRPALGSFVGYAGLHLPEAVRAGALGVQPGCSFVEVYVRLWALYEAGRESEADTLHARLRPYLVEWMSGVERVVAVEKHLSRRRGLIATNVVRAPSAVLDAAELRRIDAFWDEFSEMWS